MADEPKPPPTPKLYRFPDLLPAWKEDAEAAFDSMAEGKPRGPITGLPELDRTIGEYFRPGLHVLHGNAGTGKTAFCLQTGASCAAPCLYVSAEMGALELFRRHTARVCGVFLHRLKSGELTP